jgi:DNA-binding IclR family transcriptional regulator
VERRPDYQPSRVGRKLRNHLTCVRLVWAAVTAHPDATRRELAAAAGLPLSTTNAAVRKLRDAGYIDYRNNRNRTTRIIVPFVAPY